MWKTTEDQMAETRLDRMSSATDQVSPSLSARYKSAEETELKREVCILSTRIEVIANVLDWACNGRKGEVYWLNDIAGTGKTTIAYSACLEPDAIHKLAASFFHPRTFPECWDVNHIIPSIAYQLARVPLSFQFVLSAALHKGSGSQGFAIHTI
ncbi:unnamed protein product [Rhizoctonia solani]|uniref:Nephrocystin 3-like N-terminal domain-containing protein n=1 Tax=Rhizoctonia solani TaxID=456999 RepID=A0A8H3GRF1_9AGAM|nr:unnamed protein product [Rhizoctonia solani]